MAWTAEEAIIHWQKKGLLTAKKAKELKDALTKNDHFDEHGMPRALAIFATVGAILIGLGVLFFIASNWSNMPPIQRILTLMLVYAVSATSAYVTEKRGLPTVSEALWLLTDIIFGANIILLAQIFNYSLTYWQGPFLWGAGTVAMGFARKHVSHAYLAVPLLILALGWVDSNSGWFLGGQFEFLASDRNILPVLSVLGIGLVSLALLLRNSQHLNFTYGALIKWGAALIVIPIVISTFDASVPGEIYTMTGSLKQFSIIVISTVLAIFCAWKGGLENSETKVYFVTLLALLLSMLIQADGHSGVGLVFKYSDLLYFLYILAVFAVALWTVWVGILNENKMMVNYGIVISSVIIIIQYFSWTFALLDRSLAFIIGGILLITLTIFIEKKRKKILSSFDS